MIDGFTETDKKLLKKFFTEKLEKVFDKVNVMVKLDEMKISNSSIKAFLEDTVWVLRNYKKNRSPGNCSTFKYLKSIGTD